MNKTATGLCCAAALGLAVTLGAQAPTTTASSKDHDVTVSGCLSKAATGYTLTNARVEPGASASTTTTPGSTTTASPTPTTAGATGTTGAVAGSASPAMTWMLTGDSELEKHVGHKIQVTGKTTWDASMEHGRTSATTATAAPPATTTSGSTTPMGSADQPRLDVKSIKMVSASCS